MTEIGGQISEVSPRAQEGVMKAAVVCRPWSMVSSLALGALLFALSLPAEAQQLTKVPRIGYLSGTDPAGAESLVKGFRQGLQDLGYIEGNNILVEYRYAERKVDRIPSLVAELVQLNIDVLVSTNVAAIRAAKQATKTIPIVMVITQDPVATGLVNSLARPGGNVTGVTRLTSELSEKRLELLKETVPTISRVGVLISADRTLGIDLKEYEVAARALKIQLQSLVVQGPNPDLNAAFQAVGKGRGNALITGRGAVLLGYRKQIAELSIKNRLPLMSEGSDFVDAGGLISYAANDADSSKRAAYFVDRVLKGAKPADLPVEQPTKFELVINLKTAKQIGVTIPDSVLFRADRVIR